MIQTVEAEITGDEPRVDGQGRKILDAGRWRKLMEDYESSGVRIIARVR